LTLSAALLMIGAQKSTPAFCRGAFAIRNRKS
jgi:hypothetical protein